MLSDLASGGEHNGIVTNIFERECRTALADMLSAQSVLETEERKLLASKTARAAAGTVQPDAPVSFMQLSRGWQDQLSAAGDVFELGLSQALGTAKKETRGAGKGPADFGSTMLSKASYSN